jgi:hypothetical protein
MIVGGVLFLFACLVIYSILYHRADTRSFLDFDDRFPPLSDDQYLALFPPGTDHSVALKVRNIVARQLAIPSAQIYPSARFFEDLGAD